MKKNYEMDTNVMSELQMAALEGWQTAMEGLIEEGAAYGPYCIPNAVGA